MNCSESELNIKSSRKCPIQPKKKQKITQKQSETMIDKGKLVMDHKKHKVFWNNVALHLTRQEYNFLLLFGQTDVSRRSVRS